MAGPSTSSIPQPNKESLEDCMCTICLCILIHPVTLPCSHELCMPCFKQTVEEASLTCPLCRTRISTWARKASRTNSLVNQKRWEQIQKLFPHRVQRRLDGLDDETDEEIQEKEEVHATYRHMVQLSEPGEIRKEYEEEIKRLQTQQAAERQKEEEASAQLIQQLCSLDEQTLLETRRQQEEIVTKDSQLAEELGRLINTVESETPVNRLLQESKPNYSNYPLLPSTPSTPALSHQDGSQKGKQLLVKNSNKTLETFFRRLPSNGKRSTRSSSEPVTGVGVVSGEKSPVEGVSPRCQSAPVRGKENLPLVPHISPLHGVTDLTTDICFYEDLEMGHTYTDVQNSEDLETENACIIEEEPVEIADRTVESQGRVVIVDIHVGRREGAESASTVHSDGSESVIICEEPKQAVGEDNVTKDPHFRPIESSPHTPPRTQADAVLEPCVVHITPRLLFATDCVSSTTFPIVPSPPVSTVGSSISCDRTDNPVSVTESHRQKGTVDVNHTDKAQTQVGRRGGEKESVKCKLRSDKYSTVSGVHADQNLHNRRARSTSPPTLKVTPRRRLVSCAELGKRGFRRPTLREFRMRERMQSTIEEVVSDSELSSPSPRYRLRGDRSAAHRLLRGAGDGEKLEVKARSRQMDKVVMEESSDSESEGQSLLSAPTVSQAVRSCQKAHMASSVSKRLEDQHFAMSACGTVRREAAVYTQNERDSSSAPSQASSSSNHRDMLTVNHQQGCSSSRLVGIINPVVQLDLFEDDMCSNVTTGKGKRLLKKSHDSSLSHRNCPKSSGKTAFQSRSEGVEKSGNHDTDSIAENKTCKTSSIPQHTVPKAERSSTRSRRQCNVPTRTGAEDVLSKRDKVCAASSTHSESDSEDSEKLVRKVKRPGRHQKTASVTAGKKATETALNSNSTNKGQKKTSRTVTQKIESGGNQRSIKDWFSSSQADPSGQNLTKPSANSRKAQPRKGAKVSDSPAVESDVSTSSSSTATSPDKLAVRMSQRPRKINPKLDDFLLTVTKKLKQFKANSCTDSDSTPAPSPTKAHTTPTVTPTQNLKRKLGDRATALSPVSKRKKQSPNPCRQILQASSSDSPEKPDQCQQQDCPASSVSSSDHTPQKLDSCSVSHSVGEEEIQASEEEEGLSQEERDHRLAVQLQQQFDLADKLNLNVVRFKGTNDQYTLRRH